MDENLNWKGKERKERKEGTEETEAVETERVTINRNEEAWIRRLNRTMVVITGGRYLVCIFVIYMHEGLVHKNKILC
jgi:hypothetical protein